MGISPDKSLDYSRDYIIGWSQLSEALHANGIVLLITGEGVKNSPQEQDSQSTRTTDH
ncbi:MAG: hypothetical protein K0S39_4185 [Paenibacillus sp.]|nr:hypothetical protein [Paenibacillus sp.]